VEVQARLGGGDERQHDVTRVHASESHPEEVEEREAHTRGERRNPQPDGDEPRHDDDEENTEYDDDQGAAEENLFHVSSAVGVGRLYGPGGTGAGAGAN